MSRNVLTRLDVLPSDVNINLEELLNKIASVLPEGVRIQKHEIVPIAFSLSALRLYLILKDEEGGTEKVERAIRGLDEVDEVTLGPSTLI
ncbi:MAG: elongation factor 1-beta [Candidatus Asgardarchaeia archaeon]